jgi:L-malate glycosyltransferase
VRVLIYPHTLEIGGAQLNAIELAGALQRQGHEVVVFGQPGALNTRIVELGLEFIAAPAPSRRPSPAVVRALRELVDVRGFEILHGHEWPPALECRLAARGRPAVTAVATIASMAIAPFVPRTMPLLVGTEQIEEVERRAGRTTMSLLEPPVDVTANRPGLDLPCAQFRARYGIDERRRTVVCVSRLAHELKLEGILSAIDAMGPVCGRVPTQLVIVGDGPARDLVTARADAVNRRVGPDTVVLTGELIDPRPAYAIADVAFGMGASALRVMAFAKPLIVQGENGFWRVLDSTSFEDFLWTGWYGYGDDASQGAATLAGLLLDLFDHTERLPDLGAFGRTLVEGRYALERIAELQADFYATARSVARPAFDLRDLQADVAGAARFAGYHLRKRSGRVAGRSSRDDFNARPVARTSAVLSTTARPADEVRA